MGYADAQEGAFSRTASRSAEKKGKRDTHVSSAKSRNQRSRRAQVPEIDLSEVLDFRKIAANGSSVVAGVSRVEGYDWPVYTIDKQPGFFFIPEALTKAEQLHWATQALTTFPQPPNRTNHNATYGPIADLWAAFLEKKVLVEIASGNQECNLVSNLAEPDRFNEPISDTCQKVDEEVSGDVMVAERSRFHDHETTTSGVAARKGWEFHDNPIDASERSLKSVSAETLVRKLRWATVGVQFDWSKRAYNEALPFQEISPKLASLAARLAKPAMEKEDFKAEAAIVNFYGPDDMLRGHVDDMEADMSKPIVSISLGCKAVFLLGGSTRDEPPLAMIVRSGDVVLMAGSARQCFHGVPRIFSEEKEAELPDFTSVTDIDGVQLSPILMYLESSHIKVQLAGTSGSQVHISYDSVDNAVAARGDALAVSTASADVGIPGLTLYTDFITPSEEQELLREVDERPWQTLAKRRVQHYGYEFLYKTRNVDLTLKLGELPSVLEPVLNKISLVPEITSAEEPTLPFDQLTVNEYPRGVGLSPHIDTHSAFEGSILSLSLGGPCIIEFRKYINGGDSPVDDNVHELSVSQQQSTDLRDEPCGNSEALTGQKSGCVPNKSVRVIRKALLLPQRSLLILSGEARYDWHHYIPHHKIDFVNGQVLDRGTRRVSFTFRKVRRGPCNCTYTEHCDSQSSDTGALASDNSRSLANEEEVKGFASLEEGGFSDETPCIPSEKQDMFAATASQPKQFNPAIPEIEKRYVHKVYNAIAPHFSDTRFAKWPKVALFLESLEPGSVVADAGCGNGKYLGFNRKCFFVGCDISPPLIGICAQHGHEVFVADSLHLPHRTGFCDAGISIAVLHHLSNEERRVRAIEELLRVVRRKGRVLFTVWAVEQEDKKLLTKWTPLTLKYTEEWVDDMGTTFQRNLSINSLKSINEGENNQVSSVIPSENILNDTGGETVQLSSSVSETGTPPQDVADECLSSDAGNASEAEQQEYFVPWHLPYHRAEIGGASAAALADGLAKKDDVKRALVYNRYYHCFVEGELERLASKVQGARLVDHFYDKSNWCIILEKL